MLLQPAVAQKLQLRFVQLRVLSRCCIVFVCQRFTMLRLLWFMCRDCVRLSAINKACNLEGNLHTQEETRMKTTLGSALFQPASNIVFGYKQAQQYRRINQLGFIRAVSWSAQNAESHWSHVHITLTVQHFSFHAFYKKCVTYLA